MSAQPERLARWAAALRRRGLATPALLLLELSRPLGTFADQCLVGLAPLLPPPGQRAAQDLAAVLGEPATGAAFAALLSARDDGPR